MASVSKSISAAILTGVLAMGQAAQAADYMSHSGTVSGYEDGTDAAILVDLAMLRPLGLVSLVGGTAVYVVSLPFQLTSWNFRTPFNALVKRPFNYTFTRDLGDEMP
jgi:hypothetical protein